MCGNYTQYQCDKLEHLGSPPRVRELPVQMSARGNKLGITPACAGITVNTDRASPAHRDHPRVCGNYHTKINTQEDGAGSPPRVRELRFRDRKIRVRPRITPACAGITLWAELVPRRCRDHPRVCGNYRKICAQRSRSPGSPPRVRELLLILHLCGLKVGITPACAGITKKRRQKNLQNGDHPRVCGNYASSPSLRFPLPGSPPRVRELLRGVTRGGVAQGITPACAGITLKDPSF